jgi:crossover junction endodeoxyribonuclease RuvC
VADALAVALTHLARSRLAAAAARTGAAEVLAAAERTAASAGRRGWEAVLAERGVPAPSPATRRGARP